MKHEDLDLYLAIHEVYGEVPNPRSDKWLTSGLGTLCRLIQERMLPDPQFTKAVSAAWAAYGKSAVIDDAGKRIGLTCKVALAHGRECFWRERCKGQCSDDLTPGRVDHTRPHSIQNCIIECSRHNTSRQTKSIDEFLATQDAAPASSGSTTFT